MSLTLSQLQDYSNWIGRTADEVYRAAIKAGGWQQVFPGPMPRWASRIRQYFNITPFMLRLMDESEASEHLREAQTALGASERAKARRRQQQSRGMGINAWAPGTSSKPGTRFQLHPNPNDAIDGKMNQLGTALALSGDVYEDIHTRTIWFQTRPGGAVYHFKEKVRSPTIRAIGATHAGQEYAPVFKLLSPDGTGGSREVCIENIFDIRREHKTKIDGTTVHMVGHDTIGNTDEVVNVSDRLVTDSVAQGSYNYAETVQKGLPAHQRLDVNTDPMTAGYYVEPPDLFRLTFFGLRERRFPPTDKGGISLAAQNKPAP